MVQTYQCPGCLYTPEGESPKSCGKFEEMPYTNACAGHVMGTMIAGQGSLALGMPVGFNKLQLPCQGRDEKMQTGPRRASTLTPFFYDSKESFNFPFNHLNVPVWYKQEGEDFFLKIFHPRLGTHSLCVIRGADKSLIPESFTVFDVAEFEDEID